jgi:thioesterase domain-containing protein/aryl carrier-like protein
MRALGAEVAVEAADVTDYRTMRDVLARVAVRFGHVDGVFHTAGQLKDEIIALRAPRAESDVIDVKMKGALVLDELMADDEPELFVSFSSVSSILGLPGQADYSAANAFLDAFAASRAARRPGGRTLSIDWNAWQGVGMLAALVDGARHADGRGPRASATPATHPLLAEVVEDTAQSTLFRSSLARSTSWVLAEHVVKGGPALVPGTGLLEIARAALEHHPEPRAVELDDVLFIAPFTVGPMEPRTLHVRVDRQGEQRAFRLFGPSEADPFVTGKIRYVDAPPAARADVDAIRARCPREGAVRDGFLVQSFMDFGPRWGCVEEIRLGEREALVRLALPDAFVADLDAYRLHPAMLDMAMGAAQALVAGFDPGGDFYVPMSYGRLLLRRSLPRRFLSHVRLRPSGAKHTAVFDVVLYGEDREELGVVEGFVMRRVPQGALAAPVAPAEGGAGVTTGAPRRGRPETPLEAALRLGMTPDEGLEAMDRMLESIVSPQVAACTVDLGAWLERLDHEARAGRSGGAEADAAESGGPRSIRPSGTVLVGPSDPIEREIAAIWRDLLGVTEIGVHDDFFDLGGQSLVAIRLLHRIEKKYGVELPLATLFEAPTIAAYATLLRSRLGVAAADAGAVAPSPAPSDRAFRAVVTIQPGKDPEKVPFFCVHGAGGNVLNFHDLARAMSAAQPFYGIQAYGIDGVTPPHSTIEEMARAYAAELREVRPHGPYLLGGYSGGGLVAFEMAQLLTAAGEDVPLLVLIDTFHPQMPMREVNTRTRLARLRREKLRYIAESLSGLTGRVRLAAGTRALERYRSRGATIPVALRDLHLTTNFTFASMQYRPKTWPGRAILLRAATYPHIYGESGPSYGWDRHILGGVEIVAGSGDHTTILLGENARALVRALDAAIGDSRAPRAA